MPDVPPLQGLVGRRVALPGHFVDAVTVVGARPLGAGAELRGRQADGELDEAVPSREDLAPLLGAGPDEGGAPAPADPEAVRLLVESTRIRLVCAYDRQLAVSLSGICTLSHQIEAVVSVTATAESGLPLRELGLIDDQQSCSPRRVHALPSGDC